jgi:hypothetical protein
VAAPRADTHSELLEQKNASGSHACSGLSDDDIRE